MFCCFYFEFQRLTLTTGHESEPVDELVLLQVSTAASDVSGHLKQVPHGEKRGLALETAQLQSAGGK